MMDYFRISDLMTMVICVVGLLVLLPIVLPAGTVAQDGTHVQLSYTDCPKDCEALQLVFSHARTENGEKFCYCGPPEDTREIWGGR